ncbi:AAA family ATPase [Cupriavidus gilardii]|uniref:AAA family ATPase n=1 Tax=Cupriavidus gilardii TaxID=82541 RepID=A0A849B8J4_9BURK|nr:AAA family ATPase [Cupriavidus gilardii]MCT9014530.1 AAA family ATPase [Cupriavidus gilardii]MCT9054250.1 AAA family ATPase [Cupriavidus gilardii]NNH10095.1 AAA family ATPase [Cupriavidus gilardii]WNG68341.1 AAA family ATPase [Cupriavidus gilardii]
MKTILTMKISLFRPHKSITAFEDIEVPDFTIITGINGAGKSQMLEAIEQGFLRIDSIPVDHQKRSIRRFDWNSLATTDTGSFTSFQALQEQHQAWMQLRQQIENQTTSLLQFAASHPILRGMSKRDLACLSADHMCFASVQQEAKEQILEQVAQHFRTANANIRASATHDLNQRRFMDAVEKSTGKLLSKLDDDDFNENKPRFWHPVDMFQQSFARLFVQYRGIWRENQLKKLEDQERDGPRLALTDAEFNEAYGEPPWDFVNSVLEAAHLDFRINAPEKFSDSMYEPELTDSVRGTTVRFNDLSSGERILMSFALCLYYAQDGRQIVDYPALLLFDEIDAPLHPSMTQSLLQTIQRVLVQERGIKVIMTTHSPSTVALAPAESLFAMQKTGRNRLIRVSRDAAIGLLTAGVPTLSVRSENRRQVFVESCYDVDYYDALFQKLKSKLDPSISISFISSGTGKHDGGSSRVKYFAGVLADAGNNTAYGLVDWDMSNFPEGNIFVLGCGQRYSIENYILDPLLIAILLVREKFVDRADMGLSDNENFSAFERMDNERLQVAVDCVVSRLCGYCTANDPDRVDCSYVGGAVVKVPKHLLLMQGHDYERALKDAFPKLNAFNRGGDSALKMAVLEKVIDDLPQFVPICILNVFQDLQRGPTH